jgi:hypothetical protein
MLFFAAYSSSFLLATMVAAAGAAAGDSATSCIVLQGASLRWLSAERHSGLSGWKSTAPVSFDCSGAVLLLLPWPKWHRSQRWCGSRHRKLVGLLEKEEDLITF